MLLRSEKDSRLVQPGLQVLRDAGVAFSEINAEAVRKIEPAINPDTEFLGGIHLPDDEVANCRQFALLLKDKARLHYFLVWVRRIEVLFLKPIKLMKVWHKNFKWIVRQKPLLGNLVCKIFLEE